MHTVRHRVPRKKEKMALNTSLKKFSMSTHGLVKVRTVAYVCVGVVLLYCSKHGPHTSPSLSGQMQQWRAAQASLKLQIAHYRNTSVAYCIHGLHNLLRDFLTSLQVARQAALDDPQPPVKAGWGAGLWGGGDRRTLHQQTDGYFDILHTDFPFVKTVFLEKETTKVGIFLNDDYYHYVSNQCGVLDNSSLATRLSQLYNASCLNNVSASLPPTPLADRLMSLNIGLPNNYQQVAFSKFRKWTYVHLLQSAVVSPYGEVTARNLSLYPSGCRQVSGLGYFRKTFSEVFTIAGAPGDQAAHPTLAELPRLAPFLPFLLRNPDVKVHVGERSELHGLLGLSPDRLVSGSVQARLVYMPAGLPCHTSDILRLQLLSYYLRRNLANASRNRTKVLLLSRTYSPHARFRQHADISAMLRQEAAARALEVEEFADDAPPGDVGETQRLFNSAVLVVAPHGAALANVVFCQPGTAVVEALQGGQEADMTYAALALALGLRYYALHAHNTPPTHVTPQDLRGPVTEYLGRLGAIRTGANQPF